MDDRKLLFSVLNSFTLALRNSYLNNGTYYHIKWHLILGAYKSSHLYYYPLGYHILIITAQKFSILGGYSPNYRYNIAPSCTPTWWISKRDATGTPTAKGLKDQLGYASKFVVQLFG